MKSKFSISLVLGIMAVFMVAACSQDLTLDSAAPAIRFETADGPVQSKGLISQASGLTEFSVWCGFTNAQQQTVETFNGDRVWKNSQGEWTYTPIRYWAEGFYDFMAVYPKAGTGLYQTEHQGQGVLRIFDFNLQSTQEDLMWASCQREYTAAAGATVVPFHFQHLLSLIDFQVKLKDNSSPSTRARGMKILSFKLYDIPARGDCIVDNGTFHWAYSKKTSKKNPYAISEQPMELTTQFQSILHDILVFPVVFDNEHHIMIDLTYEDYATGQMEVATREVQIGALQMGKHYVFKMIFDPEVGITFDVPEVLAWGTALGGSIIVPV